MEKWSMDKEEYSDLKAKGWKDTVIAKSKHISTRTLDRWKQREGINDNLHIRRKQANETKKARN